MKINGKHEVVRRIARCGMLFAAPLALVLCLAGVGGAQSSGPTPQPQQSKPTADGTAAVQTPASAAKPAAVAAQPEATGDEKTSAQARREGIAIHGHWTIEVRNPDGSVDKHVEFENGICPTQTGTDGSGNPVVFPGGALFLSQVATAQLTVGPWMVFLGNNTAALNPTDNVPPGCLRPIPGDVGHSYGISLIQNVGLFTDLSPGTTGFDLCGAFCVQVSGPTTPTSASPTISLGGIVPGSYTMANGGGQINMVSTANISCAATISYTVCPTIYPSGYSILTGTQLTPISATPPVPYKAGQSLAVSVVLSFQ